MCVESLPLMTGTSVLHLLSDLMTSEVWLWCHHVDSVWVKRIGEGLSGRREMEWDETRRSQTGLGEDP